MMRILAAYLIGLLFGLGIVFSGMSNPAKVLNFFDIAGTWDPSLIFVMGGALTVTFMGYRLIFKRSSPMLDNVFHAPAPGTNIDLKLVGGAALFGIGWGISGLCPGGAVPALGSGRYEIVAVMASLMAGVVITRFTMSTLSGRRNAAATGD